MRVFEKMTFRLMLYLYYYSFSCIIRDTETGDPERLPAHVGCWAIGTNKVNKCAIRKIIFCTGLTRQDKNLLYRHHEPNKPTKNGPLSYLLREAPFASVSTVSRGHPSLVSLCSVYNLHIKEKSK